MQVIGGHVSDPVVTDARNNVVSLGVVVRSVEEAGKVRHSSSICGESAQVPYCRGVDVSVLRPSKETMPCGRAKAALQQ